MIFSASASDKSINLIITGVVVKRYLARSAETSSSRARCFINVINARDAI